MDDTKPSIPRRELLIQAARVVGAGAILPAGAYGGSSSISAGSSPDPGPLPPPPYLSLSPDEATFIEALVNVMCPVDEHSPNGVDCGLATYIDRQLAGPFGKGAGRYQRGPFRSGKPQLGLQLPLTPEQFFKAGIAAASAASLHAHGRAFDQLPNNTANEFLTELASGRLQDGQVPLASWFNDLVYPLFVEACFSDPMYGGNRDAVFWKMIGYPGLPATHTLDMVKYRGTRYPGASTPKSIVDFS
jgi:gluconate 2-dehydrogenase gamma chain